MSQTLATDNKTVPAEGTEVIAAPKQKTTGEKWYHWTTLVTNFVGTFVSSGLIAFGVLRNEWYNKTVTDPMAEKIGRKQANTINNTFWLMQGGNLMLIPMHFMEKNMKPMVQYFNRKFGKEGEVEAYEKRHQDVPKKSWGDFIKGRAVAFLVVWASFTTAEKFLGKQMGAFVNGTGEKFSAALKKDAYKKDTHGNVLMEKDLDGNDFQVPTMTNEVGRMFSLDFFATASAVTILDVAAGFFSGSKKKSVQQPTTAQPQATAPTAESKRDDNAPSPDAAPEVLEKKHTAEVQPKAKPEARKDYTVEREKERTDPAGATLAVV